MNAGYFNRHLIDPSPEEGPSQSRNKLVCFQLAWMRDLLIAFSPLVADIMFTTFKFVLAILSAMCLLSHTTKVLKL